MIDILGPTAHFGYAVGDLDVAMAHFGALFEVDWQESCRDQMREFRTSADALVTWQLSYVHSQPNPRRPGVALELLCGARGSTWHTSARAKFHHVAYWVPDVARSCAELQEQGWQLELGSADVISRPMSFAYLTRPDRSRIELNPDD